MADNQRWFKLWCPAPSDDAILALLPAVRWAWAALGCYTKLHGTHGKVEIRSSNGVLAEQMGVPRHEMINVIKLLPNVTVEEGNSVDGKFTVTWKNWVKYQEDSTVNERQKRSRSKRRGEERERRGEEKRIKEEQVEASPPVDNSKKEEEPEGAKELAAMVEHIYRKDPNRFAKLIVWVRGQTKKGWKAPELIKALVEFNLRDTKGPVTDWWPYLTKACQAIRTRELQGEAAAHVVRDPSSMAGILSYMQKGEA